MEQAHPVAIDRKRRAGKGACDLGWDDVAEWCEGMVGVLAPDVPDKINNGRLRRMRDCFGDRAHIALTLRRRADDRLRIHRLDEQATAAGIRSAATCSSRSGTKRSSRRHR